MHLLGFYHDDFEERNVVRGRQGYRIIDLEHAYKHRCRWDPEHDDWNVEGYYEEDFSCEGLKTAGAYMDIWGEDSPKTYIKILSVVYSGPALDLFPPKYIIDCLIPSGIGCTGDNVEFSECWLKKFKKEMDSTPDCNIEELVAKYQAIMADVPDVSFGDKVEFKKYNPKSIKGSNKTRSST